MTEKEITERRAALVAEHQKTQQIIVKAQQQLNRIEGAIGQLDWQLQQLKMPAPVPTEPVTPKKGKKS